MIVVGNALSPREASGQLFRPDPAGILPRRPSSVGRDQQARQPVRTYAADARAHIGLLVRDSKRRVAVSAAIWIPVVMLCVFSTRPPMASCIAIALIIGFFRGVKWGQFFAANLLFIDVYAYFLLSVIVTEGLPDQITQGLRLDSGSAVHLFL